MSNPKVLRDKFRDILYHNSMLEKTICPSCNNSLKVCKCEKCEKCNDCGELYTECTCERCEYCSEKIDDWRCICDECDNYISECTCEQW